MSGLSGLVRRAIVKGSVQSRGPVRANQLPIRTLSGTSAAVQSNLSSDSGHDKTKTTSCWSCGKPVACCTYFCPHCKKVLKPAGEAKDSDCTKCSYFEMLSVPETFSIDTKALEQNFKRLQMTLHPDRVGSLPKEEQELSAVHSSKLNEAYATLRSPVKRALYLLEQKGNAAVEEGKTETDLEILTEAMEYREKLEELQTTEELLNLKTSIGKVINDLEKELAAAIGDTALIDHSVRTAVRMRYLEKVQQEIDEKIRSMM